MTAFVLTNKTTVIIIIMIFFRNFVIDDNIEEGRFAEKSWAGLLSYPLTKEEEKVLLYVIPSKPFYPQVSSYLAHLENIDEQLFSSVGKLNKP